MLADIQTNVGKFLIFKKLVDKYFKKYIKKYFVKIQKYKNNLKYYKIYF